MHDTERRGLLTRECLQPSERELVKGETYEEVRSSTRRQRKEDGNKSAQGTKKKKKEKKCRNVNASGVKREGVRQAELR